MFNIPDAGISQAPIIHKPFHGVAETGLIRFFVENGRVDDERLFMSEKRNSAADVASPPRLRETERCAHGRQG